MTRLCRERPSSFQAKSAKLNSQVFRHPYLERALPVEVLTMENGSIALAWFHNGCQVPLLFPPLIYSLISWELLPTNRAVIQTATVPSRGQLEHT